jgi:hypothetical protein
MPFKEVEAIMIKTIDPKTLAKPIVRCSSCDSEVTRYFTFISPTDERKNVCWECQMREEKGFNADKHFSRSSRTGRIPR